MNIQLADIVLSALTAVSASGLTYWLAWRADRNLENDEIRKRKIEAIFKLLGSRYVMSSNYRPSAEEVREFNTAMALISVLFAGNKNVATAYDRFISSKTDDNLVQLLHKAASTLQIELFDSAIKTVITVPGQLHILYCLPNPVETTSKDS